MIYEINTQYGGKVKVQPRVELYTVKDAIMGKELYGIAIDLDEQDGGYPTPFARLTLQYFSMRAKLYSRFISNIIPSLTSFDSVIKIY